MFCRYALRTTDAGAGRRFYAEAIGLALPEGRDAGSVLEAWPLHERARALGAPAHWLGQVAVDDVEESASRLVALGGERLGPSVQVDAEVSYATVRDPFGAVVAVRRDATTRPTQAPVAWHQLHTTDAERAMGLYAELCGWVHTQTVDVPEPKGGHRLFAYREGQAPVGAIANTARWPGVHAHWLFHFPVPDLDAAVSRVRALGGTALDPISLPDLQLRLAACEDPQGAAFGLVTGA